MNGYSFILAHGFGFNNNYWENFIQQLGSTKYMFFSDNLVLDPNEKYIGLGHSLGFVTLSNSTINLDIMVGLQCFCNFIGSGEKLRRIRKSNLDQMVESFNENPRACLKSFYDSCGHNGKLDGNIAMDKLSIDLQTLYNSFLPRPLPTLVIGGTMDNIVPKILIKDNFKKYKNITTRYIPLARHTLGYDLSTEIIKIITSFIHDQKT
jgi:hypothetical protein